MPSTLLVNEVFDSLQGEGLRAGTWHTFVRLTGCNLRCPWCDTKYAFDEGAEMLPGKIAAQCGQRVCITGGEPLLQPVGLLLAAFESPRVLTIETNGTIPPDVIPEALRRPVLWSVSPKLESSGAALNVGVVEEFAKQRDVQWKLVFDDPEDWKRALYLRRRLGDHPIFLQPNGARWQGLMRWAWDRMTDWVGSDARLMPQMHVTVWGQDRCK